MGWWKQGDDLLGDGPADTFTEGMNGFISEHGKPSWQQFVDALDAALSAERHVRAVLDDSKGFVSDSARADPQLRTALTEIVRQIREEYQQRRERDATVSEIVATAQFCLSVDAERLFSDGLGARLKGLSLE